MQDRSAFIYIPPNKNTIGIKILPWYLGLPEESVSDVGLELKTVASTVGNII